MENKMVTFQRNNSTTIKSIGLVSLGITGLLCLTSKNRTTNKVGVGLLGLSAIGTFSSFINPPKSSLSKTKVILFGGADFSNEGKFGTNKEIARIVATSAVNKGIELNNGDITIFNSPLTVNDFNKDIVKPLITAITKNFDVKNGKVILYGYSLGGNILMYCLNELQKNNINVDLLITIDAAKGYPGLVAVKTEVPNNVKLNLNLYQIQFSSIGSRGFPNHGKNVINVDLSERINAQNEQINHGNIDEYTMLFISQLILYYIAGNNVLKSMTKNEIIEKIDLYDKQR